MTYVTPPREPIVAQTFASMAGVIDAACEGDPDAGAVTAAIEALESLRSALRALLVEDRTESRALLLAAADRAGYAARNAPAGLARTCGSALSAASGSPYALCVALMLPFALAFNRRTIAARIGALAPAFVERGAAVPEDPIAAADLVIASIRTLGRQAGLPANFRGAGIKREAMEMVAKSLPAEPAALEFARSVESTEQMFNEVFRFAW